MGIARFDGQLDGPDVPHELGLPCGRGRPNRQDFLPKSHLARVNGICPSRSLGPTSPIRPPSRAAAGMADKAAYATPTHAHCIVPGVKLPAV